MRENLPDKNITVIEMKMAFWDINSLETAWYAYANAEYRDKSELWDIYVAIRDNKVKLTH